ncbi:MAG: DNA starvation/stationary phase protection protein [Alphaproteobacteria bacterium]|nr:DNA starvation/stationary phase protection protein [Alphaproteobacteria bacterium]
MLKWEEVNSKIKIVDVNNGLKAEAILQIVQNLSIALASTYILYLKTQGFHWNNVGPLFYSLHKLSEEQYQELAEATDILAERIRALGHVAPASFSQFKELSKIKEDSHFLTTLENIKILIADHELMASFLREISQTAQDLKDEATADLYAGRIANHEKSAWMLRALIS